MSLTYRVGEGATLLSRAITGIAGGVVTYTGTDFTNPVGAVFELTGTTGTAANNVVGYTCTAFNAGTNQLTLRPAPVDDASGTGSVVMKNRTNAKGDADGLTSVIALGENLSLLEVAGNGVDGSAATFITDGVVNGDYLQVTGDSVAANNGLWIVHGFPLSETRVVVRSPNSGGAGLTADASSDGVVAVRHGGAAFFVTGEANWGLTDLAAATPVAGPGGSSMGSGSARDHVQLIPGLGGSTVVLLHGVGSITVNGSGADSAFLSTNETIVGIRTANPGVSVSGDIPNQSVGFVVLGSDLAHFTLGEKNGNEFSASAGSVMVGLIQGGGSSLARWRFYGSYFHHLVQQNIFQEGIEVVASIVRRDNILGTGGGHVVRSGIFYGTSALLVLGALDAKNLIVPSQTALAGLTAAVTIEGLLISDETAGPWTATAAVTILNPQEDYDITTHPAFGGGANFTKKYAFNRRFIASANDAPPAAVAGYPVQIFEIKDVDDLTTLVFTGTTDANGMLNAGDGVDLRRQNLGDGLFSYRLSGPGLGTGVRVIMSEETGDELIPSPPIVYGVPPIVDVTTAAVSVNVTTPVVAVDPETGIVEVVEL